MTPARTPVVLVVEDSADERRLIVETLRREHLSVVEATGAADGARLAAELRPDLVVLDLNLPDGSGFDLLRDLVTRGTSVLVLSGRSHEMDRVLGLELGADDYVVKPFYPRELAARVRRSLQRRAPAPTRVDVGGLVVDSRSREVRVGGEVVALTDREFDLVAHLARSPRHVFSRDDLLRDVWGSSPDLQSPKTVTEHIRRLRRKLGPGPEGHRWIVTVGSSGYRLDPAPRRR